jgi:hypothetical protein
MTNCGPNGSQLNEELSKWVLEAYLGVIDKDPEPIALGDAALAQYEGDYETVAATVAISAAEGRLTLQIGYKPATIEQIVAEGGDAPEQQPPVPIGLLPGDGDRYIVVDGPAKGMRGYFVRDASGAIEAAHIGGRLATRVKVANPA